MPGLIRGEREASVSAAEVDPGVAALENIRDQLAGDVEEDPTTGLLDLHVAQAGGCPRTLVPFLDSSYTFAPDAALPFICEACRWFEGEELEGAGPCRIVDGPYDGFVGSEDSCRFFKAAPVEPPDIEEEVEQPEEEPEAEPQPEPEEEPEEDD